MSILQVKQSGVFVPVGGAGGGWIRPADWLALPSVVSGDQKFVGLAAVYAGGSNWVHLSAQQAYTVNWGDGSAPENVATGVVAYHNLSYAGCVGTDSTRGYRQAIITVTPQSGNLIVLNLAPVTRPTGMVSGWSSPWLDVKMAGALVNNLTISTTATRAAMLERFEFVGPSVIISNVPAFSNCRSLQEVVGTAWTSGVTSFASMFLGCASLRTIPLLDTGAGLGFSQMFNGCTGLEEIPLLNTAAGLDFNNMFFGCATLRAIPLLNTAAGTNFSGMFNGCTVMQTFPLLNTGAGTNFSNMFVGCNSLQSVPALNVAAGTDFTTMFGTCMSLQSAPLAGTSRSISYASCKLKGSELDAIYTALATLLPANMLSANASSVETSATDWWTNVVNCAAQQAAANVQDGTVALRMTATATGEATSAITTRIAVSASTAYTFMASAGNNVATGYQCRVKIVWHDAGGAVIGTDTGTSIASGVFGNLSAQPLVQATSPVGAVTASLVLSFTATAGAQIMYFDKMGLFPGTVTTWRIGGAQTITVTSNWDVANDTPSIATAKGWTVTG